MRSCRRELNSGRALLPLLLPLPLALLGCGADDSSATEGLSGASAGYGTTLDMTGETTGADLSSSSGSDSDSDSSSASSSSSDASETGASPPEDCGALTHCVELATDPENCGQCGVSCVVPNAEAGCVAGACAIGTCLSGYADCDGDLFNGCEQTLAPGEACPLVCGDGATELCNLFDDDCDGLCDEDAPACRQGVHRAYSPTLGHLYTLDQAEASSGDFNLEFANFFYLYAAPQPGLAPLYRCLLGNGKRFYTSSESCEGAGENEGALGYLSGDPLCGGVSLYRLYKPGAGHFYTTSASERDNAVDNLGYTFESTVGHVWADG